MLYSSDGILHRWKKDTHTCNNGWIPKHYIKWNNSVKIQTVWFHLYELQEQWSQGGGNLERDSKGLMRWQGYSVACLWRWECRCRHKRSVQKVSSHVLWKIETFIGDPRSKKHCTQDNDTSVSFKVGTFRHHTVLPIVISYPVIFS